jgi:hypothetical protein
MNTKRITLCSAALGVFALSLLAQTTTPPATPFGLIGVGGGETARLNAYCRADIPPGPCVVGFAFFDAQGNTLKQVTLTLMPGRAGSLDIQGVEASATLRTQIVPAMKVGRGAVLATLEVFDNQTGATRAVMGPVASAAQ